jgi:hypothetical protein
MTKSCRTKSRRLPDYCLTKDPIAVLPEKKQTVLCIKYLGSGITREPGKRIICAACAGKGKV